MYFSHICYCNHFLSYSTDFIQLNILLHLEYCSRAKGESRINIADVGYRCMCLTRESTSAKVIR